MSEPTREIILAYIEEARQRKQSKAKFVRARLEEDFPELVGKTVTRGGKTHDVIDYLISDIGAYA